MASVNKLTANFIKQIEPTPGKRVEYFWEPGAQLGVRVLSSGSCSFVCRSSTSDKDAKRSQKETTLFKIDQSKIDKATVDRARKMSAEISERLDSNLSVRSSSSDDSFKEVYLKYIKNELLDRSIEPDFERTYTMPQQISTKLSYFKLAGRYRFKVGRRNLYLDDIPFSQITYEMIEQIIDERKRKSNSSARHMKVSFSSLWTANRKLTRNIVSDYPSIPNKSKKFAMSLEEFQRTNEILDQLYESQKRVSKKVEAAAIKFIMNIGSRSEESLILRWKDGGAGTNFIDLANNRVHFRVHKTDQKSNTEFLSVGLTPGARQAIERLQDDNLYSQKGHPFIFFSDHQVSKTGYLNKNYLNIFYRDYVVKKLAKEFEWSDEKVRAMSMRRLRNSFISVMINDLKVEPFLVADQVKHNSINTTWGYRAKSDEVLNDIISSAGRLSK